METRIGQSVKKPIIMTICKIQQLYCYKQIEEANINVSVED